MHEINNYQTTVYLLEHSHIIEGTDDIYETKILGIYSSYHLASEAIEYYKSLDGFNKFPNDFCISSYLLNERYWNEGFI